MKIKAIGFDIGGTLVNYNKPLNWSASYQDALQFMCKENQIKYTEEILEFCKNKDIKCAVYTDVAYGIGDEFSLKDIEEIKNYIDLKLTSENVGYRKLNSKGFKMMLDKFECNSDEILYIGDEEKDIKGAKSVNVKS